jgi:hypothetical protein
MQRFYSRWGVALILVVAFVTITPAAPKNQQLSNGVYNDTDRPVFLLINLEDEFRFTEFDRVTGQVLNQADDTGSRVYVLQIGTYRGGFDIFDTRYEGLPPEEVDLNEIALALEAGGPYIDPDTGEPYLDPVESLDHNDATVLGSFKTTGDGTVHMVTPVEDIIPQNVQQAFFNASPFLHLLVEDSANGNCPTTHELACFVYENQGTADAAFNDIHHAMFASRMKVGCTTCRAEGALFPHQPNSNKLFDLEFLLPIDKDAPDRGKLTADILRPIQVDIKGGTSEAPFNLGSNGLLPVTIPTTAHFDATNVDVDSIYIRVPVDPEGDPPVYSYVYAVKSNYKDDDGNGTTDLVVHFDTQQLVEAGVDEYTTSLTIRGDEIVIGPKGPFRQKFTGNDAVKIVPPNK